jgi:hypothetical protein
MAYWDSNMPQGGASYLNNIVIKGQILTPLKVRTLFGATGAANFNAATGIVDVPIGTTPSTVAAGNDARFSTANVIRVKNSNPGAGQFTSIVAALASIVGASSTNTYLVEIGPGMYFETTITLPPCVYLRGCGKLETKIICIDPSGITLRISESSEISNLTIRGPLTEDNSTFPGSIGVLFDGFGCNFPAVVDNCLVGHSDTLIKVGCRLPMAGEIAAYGANLPDPNSLFVIRACAFGPSIGATTCIDLSSNTNTSLNVYISNVISYDTVPHATSFIRAAGAGTLVVLCDIVMNMIGITTPNCSAVRILDGAEARIYSAAIKSYDNGVYVESSGNAPILKVFGLFCHECVRDIIVNHPQTTGICTSYVAEAKTFVNKECSFYIANRNINNLFVSPRAGDFNTVADAVASINYIIPTTVAADENGDMKKLIAVGKFTILNDNVSVTGIGIPDGTISTYINVDSIMLSNACTVPSGTTITVTLCRASINNPFNIQLGSTTFYEGALTLPDYVSMYSDTPNTVIVQSAPLRVGLNCRIQNINFKSAESGITAILADGLEDSLIERCTFCNYDIAIDITSSVGYTNIANVTCSFIKCNIGIRADGNPGNGNTGLITLQNILCSFNGKSELSSLYGIKLAGANISSTVSISSFLNYSAGTAVFIEDGGSLIFNTSTISGCNNGLVVGNAGLVGPLLKIGNISISSSTQFDINVLHPNATGVINGTFRRNNAFIHPTSTVAMNYLDPVVSGTTMIGDVYLGNANTSACNVAPLIENSIPVGLIEGGELQFNSGLNILINEGSGYTTYNNGLQRLVWINTILPLIANTQNYICIKATDTNPMIITQLSMPDTTKNIYLGRVVTTETGIEFIDKTAVSSHFMANHHEKISRNTIGAIYAPGGGSDVTAFFIEQTSASAALIQLSIGAGTYYYGQVEFHPIGQLTPASFNTYYHSLGQWVHSSGVNTIDYMNYDSLEGLIPIPVNNYVKHTLYLVGDGDTETYMMVYGNESFADEQDCISGKLPIPPSYFSEGVVILCSLIVHQNDPRYCNIESQKPIYNFISNGVNGTIINHSQLMNLDNDDHLQYLKTNGTRMVTGNLNMGTNDIIGVQKINNVVIEAHSSRHAINGLDPLLTGNPSSLSGSSINYQGTGPGYSLSDHVHQLTMSNYSTTLIPDQALIATAGTSSALARGDHTHVVPTGIASSIGTNNTQGNSLTAFARADHVHQGIHSLKANSGGISRYGDITFQVNGLVSLVDNGSGTFTINVPRIPQQLQQRFGTGSVGNYSALISISETAPTTWASNSSFVYQGSDTNLGSPTKFGITYSLSSTTAIYEARLWDITNSAQIALLGNIANSLVQRYHFTPTFTNVPSSASVFELQFRRLSGENTVLNLFGLYFEY